MLTPLPTVRIISVTASTILIHATGGWLLSAPLVIVAPLSLRRLSLPLSLPTVALLTVTVASSLLIIHLNEKYICYECTIIPDVRLDLQAK